MRLADVVGVMHLMVLTVIVTCWLQGRLRIRWVRLVAATWRGAALPGRRGAAGRWYLSSITLDYDLDKHLLSLAVPSPHKDVIVYRSQSELPNRPALEGWNPRATQDRKRFCGWVTIPITCLYSFFNGQGELVGLDVELMHRLAERLQVRLEFVPYTYDTVTEQLETGEIDVAVGGLIETPERLLRVGFTQPYQTATIAVVVPDHRRGEFDTWDDPEMPADVRLGVINEDVAVAVTPSAERRDRGHRLVRLVFHEATRRSRWSDHRGRGGLGVEYLVSRRDRRWFPSWLFQRPVAWRVRESDAQWVRFLDRWLDFERIRWFA